MATTLPLRVGRADSVVRPIPARAVMAVLLVLLVVPQLLLWRFLGLGPWWLLAGAPAVALIATGAIRALDPVAIPVRRVAALAMLALALCLLGGEGRFFYANTDWQVRDVVLRDLTLYPWPYVYAGAEPLMLRLPSAMYLLPAAIGKAGGFRAAELALLLQNTTILTALLALGSTLFATPRARLIAGTVAIGFSGMDVLGAVITGVRLDSHLEWWSVTQFSGHLVQLFWVPQHAFAGWTAALLYLLWRERRLTLAGFLAPLPLLALWSPLALIGAMPFAALAGVEALRRRTIRLPDIALPALASLLVLPGLLYLAAGSGAVGSRPFVLPLVFWMLFEAIEVLPVLLAVGLTLRGSRCGAPTFAVVALTLLVAPWIQIGASVDFSMRASIPALAVLAVLTADLFARTDAGAELRIWQTVAALALAIGLATPLGELRRALAFPTSPAPLCSFMGLVPGGYPTYTAPLSRVSAAIRPEAPALIVPHDPKRCWAREWKLP